MCTNTKWITNKYTRERVLVKCGHCSACQQEKANRLTSRIRFAAAQGKKSDTIQVFITLTYDKWSVPYVRVSDLLKYCHSDGHFYDIPVYRDSERCRSFGSMRTYHLTVMCDMLTLPPSPGWHYNFKTFNKIHLNQNKGYGKIGIIYYRDLQTFEKRLLSSIRRSDSPYKVRFFNSSEYGETYFRPHFHVLAEIPSDRYGDFYSHVRKCWTMQDWDSPESQKRYQVARDCSSYVASYVNQPSDLPDWLPALFPPKHSFSIRFGYDSDTFSIANIKRKVDEGNLQLPIFFDQLRGSDSLRCMPAHVMYRYFPKFKGISRLDISEISECLRVPARLSKYAERLEYTGVDLANAQNIIRRSRNRCQPVVNSTDEYAELYMKAWSVWRQTILRSWYLQCEDGTLGIGEQFDNYHHLLTFKNHRRLPCYGLTDDSVLILPNEMPFRVSQSASLTYMFEKKRKQKKSTAMLYSDGTSVPIIV